MSRFAGTGDGVAVRAGRRPLSRLKVGNGGWCVWDDAQVAGVVWTVRLSDEGGRYVVVELHVAGRINTDVLRALPIGEIERQANHPDARPVIADRMTVPGPRVAELAALYATDPRAGSDPERVGTNSPEPVVGSQGGDYPEIPDNLRFPDFLLEKLARGEVLDPESGEVVELEPLVAVPRVPTGRPVPDDFYKEIADAYARIGGPRPAIELSTLMSVEKERVHSWIKEARRRGLMEPGRKGPRP